jgi:hypothetical protein
VCNAFGINIASVSNRNDVLLFPDDHPLHLAMFAHLATKKDIATATSAKTE